MLCVSPVLGIYYILLLRTDNSNHPDHEVRVKGDPKHGDEEGDGVPATAAVRHRVPARPVDRKSYAPPRQLQIIWKKSPEVFRGAS